MVFNCLLFQGLNASAESREAVIQSFQSLRFHARILTCILASTTFATHMNVLMCSGLLGPMLPKFDKVGHYRNFAKRHRLGFLLHEEKGPPDEPDGVAESENEDYTEVGDA
jgi:hypothetical protein